MKENLPKKGKGRPSLYGEETESMSFAVPKSKKAFLVGVVRALLKSYETV